MFVAFILIVTLLLGVPVAWVLLTAVIGLIVTLKSSIPMTIILQEMYKAIDSFPLMALPFFILAGELMGRSGIATKLVEFLLLLFGRIKGGLSYVTIVACTMFAGISGSGVANAAIFSSIMVPQMEEQGYDKVYSSCLVAGASVAGPIIPPSIIMVLYASMVSAVSVAGLFMGGIVPGIMLALSLSVIAFIAARKHNHPSFKVKITLQQLWMSFKGAFWAMLMPLIIVGGIFSGYFTPTESAAIAIFYALFVGTVIYRSLGINDILKCLLETGITTGVIQLIVAAAQPFGWILAREKIPQMLVNFTSGITDSPVILLLLLNILMIILGMFISETANIIILTPLLYPLTISYGIDPLHFGIVMLFNLTIGLISPPFGVSLFTVGSVVDVPLESLFKGIIPFCVAEIIVLLLITYIPQLVTFLPSMMGFM